MSITITAAMVNELRKRTDRPMMECKSALQEAGGEMEKAVDILRIRNKGVGDKRAMNETAEGRMGVFVDAAGSVAAPGLSFVDVRQVPQRVGALTQGANSDEITFYTIDATGLTGEGVGPANDDPLSSRPGIGFQARQDRQNGLQELAYDTGGRALLNTNDFERGLGKVYEAVSTYYTVGVNLSNLPLGKYEKEMMSFLKSRKKEILETVRTTGKLEGDLEKQLRDALTEFAKTFSVDEKKA